MKRAMNRTMKKNKTLKIKVKLPKQRNWMAVEAHFKTGAGSHKSKKAYSRKVKHRGKQRE